MHSERRDFLKTGAALTLSAGAGILLPCRQLFAAPNPRVQVAIDQTFWLKERRLNIRRSDTRERLEVVYFRHGQYDATAYKQLCWLFRDVKSRNAARHMDVALFDLIYGMQEWGRMLGSYDPVYNLSSGYRTDQRNKTVEGAASNSMHIYGKAADGTFQGIKLASSIAMANYFAAGGVGGYPTFIHLDTARNRRWGRAA